jgi:hypothetical protein
MIDASNKVAEYTIPTFLETSSLFCENDDISYTYNVTSAQANDFIALTASGTFSWQTQLEEHIGHY